jgi:peptidoglycan/xylan/chitin deacetylase (PgdA/CDA1 family)
MKKLFFLFAVLSLYSSTFSQQNFNENILLKEVAISFDDLPATDINKDFAIKEEITNKLINSITKYKIPAIGMVNEAKLYKEGVLDSSLVRQLQKWVIAGLELGNHTFSHIDFYKTTIAQQMEDFAKGDKVINELLKEKGMASRYFRYPFLRPSTDSTDRENFEKLLQQKGYNIAPVSIDNSEWIFAKAYSKALIDKDTALANKIADAYAPYMAEKFEFYERCSVDLFGRNIKHILLVHANRLNADHFSKIAKMLKERGYKFISITDALSDPAYKMKAVYDTRAGMYWPHLWPLVQKLRGDSAKRTPFTPEFVMKAADVTKE